jgi:multidrug efflux pump
LEKVTLDQQQPGLETDLIIDRGTAARLGLTVNQIDNNLYDAFGQSQVSTIYAAQNQYHVVMEVAPKFSQNPETLSQIYVDTSGGPVSGVQATRPLVGTVLAKMPAQRSKGGAVATTTRITSNTTRSLANNALANTGHGATSTGAAVSISPETMVRSPPLPISSRGATRRPWSLTKICLSPRQSRSFSPQTSRSARRRQRSRIRYASFACQPRFTAALRGTTKAFQQWLANKPVLIAVALLAAYIVLGVLL